MAEAIHFLRLPEVIKRVGLSKPTIYRLIKDNAFPAPKHHTKPDGTVGKVSFWPDHEIDAWQKRVIAAVCLGR